MDDENNIAAVPQSAEAPSPQPITPAPADPMLPAVSVFIKDSWNLYTSRIKTSALLQLLMVAAMVGMAIIGGLGVLTFSKVGANPILVVLAVVIGIIAIAAVILLAIWIQLSQIMIYELPIEEVGVKKALDTVKPYLKVVFWVSLISGFIIMGGTLLLIIPGVILGVYLAFSTYTALLGGNRGMNAVLASREYVKGYWWAAAGRLAVIALIAIVISFIMGIIGSIFKSMNLSSVWTAINYLINVVITPLYVAFTYVLYKQFVALKGNITVSEGQGGDIEKPRTLYKILGILGVVVIPLMLILSIGFLALHSTTKKTLEIQNNSLKYDISGSTNTQ